MNNILLVEDDINLGFVIQDTLKEAGFKVTLKTDGKEGLKAYNIKYDLCLLDVMLPSMDGFTLARNIKQINTDVPIIFLTAKSMVDDKVEGFEIGADDYITKPFSEQELLLRVKAVLKRTNKSDIDNNTDANTNLKFGSSVLNTSEMILLHKDQEVKRLTKKECKILSLLAQKKNEVIERELILKLIWGDDSYFNGRSLDVFITKLRKYLKVDETISIENIHGVGFKLIDNA